MDYARSPMPSMQLASDPTTNSSIFCIPAQPEDMVSDVVRFEFLAEGAANAVFRILPSEEPATLSSKRRIGFVFKSKNGQTLSRHSMVSKVLRINKGNPKTLKCRDIMVGLTCIKSYFRPGPHRTEAMDNYILIDSPERTQSFEHFLIDHAMVELHHEVVEELMNELHARCPHNGHIALQQLEACAILLPDLSSIPGSAFTIEIKPKWLAQSPDAPRDAFLCRTCALHASRKSEHRPKASYICPLQLVLGKASTIERFLKAYIEEQDDQLSEAHAAIVLKRGVSFLTKGPGHDLLNYLKFLQTHIAPRVNVPGGALADNEERKMDVFRIRVAMTLRDCSLFIRIPYIDENAPIEAKLGDLDLKSESKLLDWKGKEQKLSGGGWYTRMDTEMDHCCLVAQGRRQWRTKRS